MIDKIRRDIQARLEELLGEIDRLRRTLAALTSRGSEPASADRVTPADARTASAGEASAQKPASSAAAPTRTRTAPGATKAAVLAALKDGSAMTAGEIAAATGLGRATVSTTLSRLAGSGEITKAARGYQIPQQTDAPAVDGPGETGTPTDPAVG
jgi:DNA-binding transcriptional ArsR family regulator